MVIMPEIVVLNSMHNVFYLPNKEYLELSNSTITRKNMESKKLVPLFQFFSSLTT